MNPVDATKERRNKTMSHVSLLMVWRCVPGRQGVTRSARTVLGNNRASPSPFVAITNYHIYEIQILCN